MKGEIGVAERERSARSRTAELTADAQVAEYDQQQREVKSSADLETVRAENDRRVKTAQYEAQVAAEQRKIELERELEQRRRETQQERLRADELTRAQVDAEAQIARADGEATAIERIATAQLFKAQKEAEGLLALADAQAYQLGRLDEVSSDAELTRFYLALQRDLPQTVARETANAVRDMKPNVWAWNGTSAEGGISNEVLRAVGGIAGMMNQNTGGFNFVQPDKKRDVFKDLN
jgi:flotillin